MYITFTIFTFIGFILIFNPLKKRELKVNIKYKIIIFAIFIIGLIVRFYKIYEIPGLQIDEAMAGYDSWSLTNYGMDSTTQSWPVYLYSYGTGQSAIYAYLAIPFIKMLGLTITAIRLPMIIIASASFIFSSWTFFNVLDSKRWSFLYFILLTTNPWSIVSSRFGLDANLAPHFLLISVCILLLALKTTSIKKQSTFYATSIFFIALTAYSYSASWFMLPIFLIFLMLYLLKYKYINPKQLIILAFFLLILLIPILIFALNQFFGDTDLNILGMTVPKLSGTQLDGQTIFNGSNIFLSLSENFKSVIHFIFISNISDGLLFNSLPGFSVFHFSYFILFIIGLFFISDQQNSLAMIIKIWLISCLPIILFTKPLVHHWNLLYFPILLTMVFGLEKLVQYLPKKFYPVFLIYLSFIFLLFVNTYFFTYKNNLKDSAYNAPQELGNTINKIKSLNLNLDKIYVYTNSFPQVEKEFIYLRFFDPIPPIKWQETKDNSYNKSDNLTKIRYSNYYFIDDNQVTFEDKHNSGYLIHKDSSITINNIDNSKYDGFENDYYYFVYFN